MPCIFFAKKATSLQVPVGANLMKSLLAAGLPVASSCDGEGVCAKCRIFILQGSENLSPETPLEQFLKETNSLPSHTRISCQTEVLGDITIDASYW
ncbi:MAG: 2Fe-2S iron-sulfur cluster-binding protein [Bdellovibrio sp.]